MSQPLDLKEIEKLLDMVATVGEDFSEEGASKLPPIKMGGFMPSSRLELWQGLVYATHSPLRTLPQSYPALKTSSLETFQLSSISF